MEGAASSGTHGRYRVLRRLGVGGMAETFVAEREGPGDFVQRVCLKRILPAFANDAEFVRLFLQEARLAARLRHNNVVGVLDFGKEEAGYFLALELIEGVDLRKLLRSLPEGRLPVPIAVLVAGDVALALEYAHGLSGEGIVHRDISPSNILLSKAGEVKLGDFGIAKAMQGAGATATNSLKGKIPYMAPEQMQMTDIDGRADLFALGVVLFEMLGGKRPFDGATDVQTMTRIMQGQRVPIRRLRPDVPPPLARIVDRLLQPDRERRFRDAGELLDALSPLLPSAATRRQLARMVGEAEQHAGEEPAPEVTGARPGSQVAEEPRSVSAIRHARAEQPTSTAAERPASKRPQAPDAVSTEAEATATVADISGAPTLAMEGLELPGPGDHAGASFEPEQAAPDEATRTRLPVGGQPEPGAAPPEDRGGAQSSRSRSVTPTPARVRNRKATLPLRALVGEAGAEAHEAAVERAAAAEETTATGPSDGDAASPASPQQHASTVEVDPALREQAMASEPETATDVLPVAPTEPRRGSGLPLGALLVAALGLLVVLGGGAWWLLGGEDRAGEGLPTASDAPKGAGATARGSGERGTPAAAQNEAKPTARQARADGERHEGSSAAGTVAAGVAPPVDVGEESETAEKNEAASEEGASTKAPEKRAGTSRRSDRRRRGTQRRQTDRASQRTTDTATGGQAAQAAGTTTPTVTPSQANAGQRRPSEATRPDTSRRSSDRRYRTVGRIPAGAPTGKLEVRCIPWGDVWIDGVPMGRSPVFARVRAGSRRVECGLGARRVTRTTRVSAGGRRRLEITMGGS